MSGSIYTLRPEGDLIEMAEQACDSEALLQRLLADHQRPLAGGQIDGAAPTIPWVVLVNVGRGRPPPWPCRHLTVDPGDPGR